MLFNKYIRSDRSRIYTVIFQKIIYLIEIFIYFYLWNWIVSFFKIGLFIIKHLSKLSVLKNSKNTADNNSRKLFLGLHFCLLKMLFKL